VLEYSAHHFRFRKQLSEFDRSLLDFQFCCLGITSEDLPDPLLLDTRGRRVGFGEPDGELGEGHDRPLPNQGVGIRRIQNQLEEIDDVRILDFRDLFAIVDASAVLQHDIAKLSKDPHGSQSQGFLGDVVAQSLIETLRCIRLEFGRMAY
jgi:hypothetical protein